MQIIAKKNPIFSTLEKNQRIFSAKQNRFNPPVRRSSEIIIELIVTTNQIAVFHNSNCKWNSSLMVVGIWNFRAYCGGINRKDPNALFLTLVPFGPNKVQTKCEI